MQSKMEYTLSDGATRNSLSDFLLQIPEQRRIEEILYGDTQPIAEFLDRGDRGTVVSAANNIVDSGLRNPAHAAELVNCEITFSA